MSDPRTKFLEAMRSMRDMDLSKTPNYVTTKALYKAIGDKGYSVDDASRLTAAVTIEVCQAFVDDQELFDETVATYANLLDNLRKSMYEVSPILFWKTIERGGLSLRYQV